MNTLHQVGEVIGDRYRILDVLGQGGIGITYAAVDLQTQERVALKALSLRRLTDFKALDLFKREARILQQLNHPAIPRYLDYFEVDQPDNRYFYIVQQLAVGRSLAALIAEGWSPDEATVQDIAAQILEILAYLQHLIPPVLHRDIKPQNIIRQANGRLVLVDFGAVQDTYHNTLTGGSTVVGTYGYMAPEQFRGQATLATDLYSLGATLLFLLTRTDPADLPQRKLKIEFRPHVQISAVFADWLDHLLNPIAEERFPSATVALAVLRGEQTYSRLAYNASRRPSGSAIVVTQNGSTLRVEVPPVWLHSLISRRLVWLPITANSFSLLLLLMLLVLTLGTLQGVDVSGWLIFAGVFLMGLGILGRFLLSAVMTVRLELNPREFRFERSLGRIPLQRVTGKTTDIVDFTLPAIAVSLNRQQPIHGCAVQVRSRLYQFGSLLAEEEKVWLVQELRSFLSAISLPDSQTVR